MIVTELTELAAHRYKVFIDGEFAFVLYRGELQTFHIQKDCELNAADYRKIWTEVLPKRAKLRAMNLLQKKRYTEKQLIDKLKEGFYPAAMVETAIQYVKSFHYLDDLQFAIDYITYHESGMSRRMMTEKMREKGISGDVIKQAFEEWENRGGCQDEQAMIRELLEKKQYREDWNDKDKRRLCAFLLRKGFSIDNVNRALRMEEM